MYWKAKFGRCIAHQNEVFVFQNWCYRWLTFESMTIQTLINRRHPEKIELNYIEAMILPARVQPGEMCVLGLGGAGIMHALQPFYANQSCLVIEHNPTVIEMAYQYFGLHQLPFITVEENDAFLYLESSRKTFDYLLTDIFSATAFPEHCNTPTFIELCQKNLNPGGVLAINFANITQQTALIQHLKHYFTHQILWISLPKTTNIIALCFYQTGLQDFLTRLPTLARLQSLSWQADWGHVACFF